MQLRSLIGQKLFIEAPPYNRIFSMISTRDERASLYQVNGCELSRCNHMIRSSVSIFTLSHLSFSTDSRNGGRHVVSGFSRVDYSPAGSVPGQSTIYKTRAQPKVFEIKFPIRARLGSPASPAPASVTSALVRWRHFRRSHPGLPHGLPGSRGVRILDPEPDLSIRQLRRLLPPARVWIHLAAIEFASFGGNSERALVDVCREHRATIITLWPKYEGSLPPPHARIANFSLNAPRFGFILWRLIATKRFGHDAASGTSSQHLNVCGIDSPITFQVTCTVSYKWKNSYCHAPVETSFTDAAAGSQSTMYLTGS